MKEGIELPSIHHEKLINILIKNNVKLPERPKPVSKKIQPVLKF